MAHFALLDDNNVVQQVIVVSDDDCGGGQYPASEPIGQAFIASLGLTGTWVQTSYNHNFRKQYAGANYSYDEENDVFVAPQPFASWALDENFDWQPPEPTPTEEGDWMWDEASLSWIDLDAVA